MSSLDVLINAIRKRPGTDPGALVAGLDARTVDLIIEEIIEEEDRIKFHRLETLFPEFGPLRRELYPKHLEHFAAGLKYRERLFLAANRIGKTVAGAVETTFHLTGKYPKWWPGKRFDHPIRAWVAGDTNETTRDILQLELLGEITYRDNRKVLDGSGLIPRDRVGDPTWKQGVPNLVDQIPIDHISGGQSLLGFKSFDQGRRAFQGTAKHWIWLDEECPEDVYGECLIRTATTGGQIITTFTPMNGLTPLVLGFLPDDLRPSDR